MRAESPEETIFLSILAELREEKWKLLDERVFIGKICKSLLDKGRFCGVAVTLFDEEGNVRVRASAGDIGDAFGNNNQPVPEGLENFEIRDQGFLIVKFDEKRGMSDILKVALRELAFIIALILENKRAEEQFRLVINTHPDPVTISRLDDGRYVYVNEAFSEITGYSANEVIGKSALDIGIWFDRKDRKRFTDMLREKGRVINFETRFRIKNGRILTSLISASRFMLKGVPHMAAITRNIEAIKKLEREKENALESLRDVFERITDGVIALDKNWHFTYLNRRAARLLDREKPEELLGKNIWREYPEAVGQPFYKAYHRAMETQQPVFLQDYYEPWKRWFENRIYPSPDGLTIYFTDVTEKKQNEIRLNESEKRYRYLFENSPVALYEGDISNMRRYLKEVLPSKMRRAGREAVSRYLEEHPEVVKECVKRVKIVGINREGARLYNLSTETEFLSNLERLYSLNSNRLLRKLILMAAIDESEYEGETEIKTHDGRAKSIYIRILGYARETGEERKSYAIIAATDITGLKKVESLLNRKVKELTVLNRLAEVSMEVGNPKEYGDRVTRMVEEAVNPDVVLFYLVEGERLKLLSSVKGKAVAYLSENIDLRVGLCLCGLVAEYRKAIYSSDIWKDKRCKLNECRDAGITSYAGFPLMGKGGVGGVLAIGSVAKRDFKDEGEFLETIAGEVSIGLQNIDLLNQLKKSEAALEREVEVRTSELVKANKELEAFSYSVSHDLRAPLRAVDGFSQILYEEYSSRLDDEARRIIGIIRKNTEKMGQLIDDLLAFSRIGRKSIKPAEIDMSGLVRSIFDELTTRDDRERIEFTVEDLPRAFADPSLIRQVISNLISNAIKFTSKNENPSIRVGYRRNHERLVYFVRDNGIGFDMKYSNKLFQIFNRLHSEDEYEGTGVGLSIVKRIIEKHGGEVWAEGTKNEGATFYFSFPLSEEDRKRGVSK